MLACLVVEIFRQRAAMHVTLHNYSSACHPVQTAQQFFIDSPVVVLLQLAQSGVHESQIDGSTLLS